MVYSVVGRTVLSALDPKLPRPDQNSFPDESGKPIRCTSYGQALFSLPGSRLNPTDAAK